MVLISDGNSEIGTHVRSNNCNLICFRLLIRLSAVTNQIFSSFLKWPIFFHAWAPCSKLPSNISTFLNTGCSCTKVRPNKLVVTDIQIHDSFTPVSLLIQHSLILAIAISTFVFLAQLLFVYFPPAFSVQFPILYPTTFLFPIQFPITFPFPICIPLHFGFPFSFP